MTFDRKLLAAAAVVMAAVSVYSMRAADPDFWGHVRYGKFFAEHLAAGNGLVREDPFAYTSRGMEWLPHEYLAQIVLWLAYAAGGSSGLIVLKMIVGGAAVACLYAAIRTGADDARVWAPVFILAVGVVSRSFLFRPQVFTFLFFAYFVLMLLRHLHGRKTWLWSLPVVLAVWANMHGAFLAGIGAVGLALLLRGAQARTRHGLRFAPLGRDCGPLLLTLAACFAASLVNPLGTRLWTYLLTELTHDTNRRLIEEWRPLDFRVHTWSALTLLLLLAGLLLAAVMAQFHGRRNEEHAALADIRPWQWLLSCLPLTLMAFQAIRHIPVFALWAAPVAALLAQAAARKWQAKPAWRFGWTAFAVAVAVPAALTLYVVALNPAPRILLTGRVLGDRQPFRVAAFMKENHIRGNVYNPLWWGSYLTWELYPDVKVAMDGRNVTLFPTQMVEENMLYYTEPAEKVDPDVPLTYPSDFLLLPTDSSVLETVRHDGRWYRIYEDAQAVLFVRNDAAHRKWVEHHQRGQLIQPPAEEPRFFE